MAQNSFIHETTAANIDTPGSGEVTLFVDINTGVLSQKLDTGVVSGAILGFSAADTVTAKAGGGQDAANPVLTAFTQVSVVAVVNDSLTLPVASIGTVRAFRNDGANSMNIFPGAGEEIDSNGADAAVALAAAASIYIVATSAGTWFSFAS